MESIQSFLLRILSWLFLGSSISLSGAGILIGLYCLCNGFKLIDFKSFFIFDIGITIVLIGLAFILNKIVKRMEKR